MGLKTLLATVVLCLAAGGVGYLGAWILRFHRFGQKTILPYAQTLDFDTMLDDGQTLRTKAGTYVRVFKIEGRTYAFLKDEAWIALGIGQP